MKIDNQINNPNIKQIQPQNKIVERIKVNKIQSQPNFTGWFDFGLRFLDTNPAWGADAVDLCFMVIPRTVTDFGRGTSAGMETMRREGMGTGNHSSVPLYGALAGMAVAAGLNGKYFEKNCPIKANNIYADSETLDMMGKLYQGEINAAKTNPNAKTLNNFLVKYFENYEALSATENGKYVRIPRETAESVSKIIENEINSSKSKPAKDAIETAKAKVVSALGGVENNFRIVSGKGERLHSSRYGIDTIVDNAYKLGKAFSQDKIKATFINAADGAESAFIKAMKSMNIRRSLIGIGIASAVGVSAQPFNMWLTRKKTGTTGFVGGGEEDKSVKFKITKGLAGLAFLSGVLSSIESPKKLLKDPKILIQSLQFKGFNPTIKQFKFVYGITIFSRFLSSRNNNELSETAVKDTLGFTSWLILGNFVQKLVAQALDKDLIKKDGNGIMKWITGSVLKSRDEILHSSLGEKAFKDGKALGYNQMVKLADKATKIKLRKLSFAQIINYAYTGLVLGIGIPKLNIYLTGRREAKKAQKLASQNSKEPSSQIAQNSNISSTGSLNMANRKFLNEYAIDLLK